jgi:hypothetical protein
MAVALAFLAFYFWFFWLRGFLRSSGPDDSNGDVAVPAIIKSPVENSFDQRRQATFGKR